MQLLNEFKLVDTDVEWMKDAKCFGLGNERFFPEPGCTFQARQACDYCQDCLVKDECLAFSLNNNIQHGVWGGMTWTNRERLLINRKKSARMAL